MDSPSPMNIEPFKHLLRKIRFPQRPSLVTGPLSLTGVPEGFKFWNGKTELSAQVGLSLSWQCQGEWKDCSAFKSRTVFWNRERFQIEKKHPQDSFQILFDFQIRDPLGFEVTLTVTTDPRIEKLKITLFLHTQYKNWVAGLQEGSFPRHGAWISVGLPDPKCKRIGAYSHSLDFLPLLFSFENATHTIENGDAQTEARVLCAEYPAILPSEMKYRGRISFFENTSSFWDRLQAGRSSF